MSSEALPKYDPFVLMNKIHVIPRREEAVIEYTKQLLGRAATGPCRLAFVNAHAFNMCESNPEFFNHIMSAEQVVRDGAGMRIFYRAMGFTSGANMNGTDYIPQLIAAAGDRKIALLGTADPYLAAAGEKIRAGGGNVVLQMDGFRDEAAYVTAVCEAKPEMIILAMGMPKQERVAAEIVKAYPAPCLIVCGGAVLDFMGGKVSRAPKFLRKYGMEWLYRLVLEPRRMFKRSVVGTAVFLARTVKLSILRHFRKK